MTRDWHATYLTDPTVADAARTRCAATGEDGWSAAATLARTMPPGFGSHEAAGARAVLAPSSEPNEEEELRLGWASGGGGYYAEEWRDTGNVDEARMGRQITEPQHPSFQEALSLTGREDRDAFGLPSDEIHPTPSGGGFRGFRVDPRLSALMSSSVGLFQIDTRPVEQAACFTCPRCGAASSSPDDAEHGYCGRCHDWTGRMGELPIGLYSDGAEATVAVPNSGPPESILGMIRRAMAIVEQRSGVPNEVLGLSPLNEMLRSGRDPRVVIFDGATGETVWCVDHPRNPDEHRQPGNTLHGLLEQARAGELTIDEADDHPAIREARRRRLVTEPAPALSRRRRGAARGTQGTAVRLHLTELGRVELRRIRNAQA